MTRDTDERGKLADELSIAGYLRIENGRLLSPSEKQSIVAALSNAPAPSEGVREPDAWEWRACIGGRWGAWLYLDQPIDRFRERSAFNLANGTYELRPLYAGPTALTTPADTEDQGPDTLGERP
jgi:hypothetical protein